METIAVLLMAYGSPNSLEEIEPYLLDIRGGRPTTPELVAEIRTRYAQIGGRSPLLDITRAQAAALEEELNRSYADSDFNFRTYVGMRHWEPRIRKAVAQITADGIHTAIGLVMAPHQSLLSTGAYFSQLDTAITEQGVNLEVIRIDAWHDHPGLIDALTEKTSAALAHFDSPPYVLFTAHSLPIRILREGDPYDAQLRQTAALVAEQLELTPGRWQFCYQSAGQSQESWLGPPIEQLIADLAQAGEKNLLVTPIGFLCDHVEILYDLDIMARQVAHQHGARLERSASLNTSATFIAALADLVWSYAPSLYRH